MEKKIFLELQFRRIKILIFWQKYFFFKLQESYTFIDLENLKLFFNLVNSVLAKYCPILYHAILSLKIITNN